MSDGSAGRGRRSTTTRSCGAYPPPPEYFETAWLAPPDEIERTQLDAAARARAARRRKVPFFARALGRGGLRPHGDRHARRPLARRRRTPSTTSARASTPTRRGATTRACTPDRRAARADARVHVGRHHRQVAARPSTRSGTARSARCSPRARSTCRASAPATSCSTRGPTARTTARSCFDEALYRWLNCVVLTTSTGNVTSSERQVELAIEYGATAILTTGDYLLRLADVAAEMGYDPATDLKHPGAAQHRRPRAARGDVRRRVLPVVRLPRGAVGVGRVPGARRPAHLRGRVRRADRRSRDRRAAARRRAGLDLHHRALQDRQPAVPLQHHGSVVPVPARAVRVRELAAQDGAVRRPRRQHGEAARRQRVARGASATIARRVAGAEPDYFVRAVRDGQPRRADRVGGERRATRRSTTRLASAIEQRLKERLGVRIARRGRARPGALDELTEVGTVAQAQAVPRRRGPRRPMAESSTTCATRSRPTARAVWDGAHRRAGVAREGAARPDDSFAEPDGMVARMDELGIATLLLPTGDIGRHGTLDPFDFEHVAARGTRSQKLADALARAGSPRSRSIDPTHGMRGVRERARAPRRPVGRRLLPPHAQLRPPPRPRRLLPVLRARAPSRRAGRDAGGHVGRPDAERVRPPDRHRPPRALLPRHARSCSRTSGWPWVDEAIAMALKFPNVFLGTGAYPPRHWPTAVLRVPAGPGPRKVMFGTNFPTVGHRHALGQVAGARARPPVERRPARRHGAPRLHPTRGGSRMSDADDRQGLRHPAAAAGRGATRTASRRARSVRGRVPRPRPRDPASTTYKDNPEYLAELREKSPEGGFTDEGVSIHVCGTRRRARVPALRRVRRRAALPLHPPHRPTATIVNNVIDFDATAHGDMLPWALELRTRPCRRCSTRRRRRVAERSTPASSSRPRRRRACAAGSAFGSRERRRA